jgi:recA bacterial DNA recombination protein
LFEQKVYTRLVRAAFPGRVARHHRVWNKEDGTMQTALRLLDKEAMDKQRALDAALGQIERAFGKGSIMKLGSREAAADTEVISSGSLGLDIARADRRDLRAGELRQDDACSACHCRSAARRRHLRLH